MSMLIIFLVLIDFVFVIVMNDEWCNNKFVNLGFIIYIFESQTCLYYMFRIVSMMFYVSCTLQKLIHALFASNQLSIRRKWRIHIYLSKWIQPFFPLIKLKNARGQIMLVWLHLIFIPFEDQYPIALFFLVQSLLRLPLKKNFLLLL